MTNNRPVCQDGDKMLKEVGTAISSAVRQSDIAGRYGGDEFIVMLNCPEAQVRTITERIKNNVADRTGLGCSIGVAFIDDAVFSSKEPDDRIIRNADAALYAAKRKGRSEGASAIVYYHEIDLS